MGMYRDAGMTYITYIPPLNAYIGNLYYLCAHEIRAILEGHCGAYGRWGGCWLRSGCYPHEQVYSQPLGRLISAA